jgi:hypothetical protein
MVTLSNEIYMVSIIIESKELPLIVYLYTVAKVSIVRNKNVPVMLYWPATSITSGE